LSNEFPPSQNTLKSRYRLGLAPEPNGGAYSARLDSWVKGVASPRRGWIGGEGRTRGRIKGRGKEKGRDVEREGRKGEA